MASGYCRRSGSFRYSEEVRCLNKHFYTCKNFPSVRICDGFMSGLSYEQRHQQELAMSNPITNINSWLDKERAVATRDKNIIPAVTYLELVQHSEPGGYVLTPRTQTSHVVEAQELNFVNPDNNQSLPADFTTVGQIVQFKIPRQAFGHVRDINIIWKLKETGASNDVQIVPLAFLCNRIEFWGNGPNGQLIQTLRPETMFFYSLAFFAEEQQKRWGKYLNYSNSNGFGQAFIKANTTAQFVWPLFGNFITQSNGLFMPALAEDLYVKLYLATNPVTGGINIGSTAAGTLGINNIQLELELQDLSTADANGLMSLYRNNTLEKNYLDTVVATNLSAAFTAGSPFRWQLSALTGYIPYFFVLIRTTGQPKYVYAGASAVSSNKAQSVWGGFSIGDEKEGAGLSIENSSTQIISGTQQYLPKWLQSIWSAKNLPGRFTDIFSGWYPFFFGDIAKAESEGSRKGAALFDTNQWLNITPGSTGTAETAAVVTVVAKLVDQGTTTAAAKGLYTITFAGMRSPAFAFNQTLVQVQAWMDQMCAKTIGYNGCPIVCTVTGGAAATSFATDTTGLIFTFNNLPATDDIQQGGTAPVSSLWTDFNFRNSLIVDFLEMSSGAAAALFPHITYTKGTPQIGLVTGTYQLDVIARVFTHCHLVPGPSGSRFVVKGYAQ
jgi:hypothetical protein